jgi:hypothetical protein
LHPLSRPHAQKRRWIRFSIRDCAWIISTAASVSPSVIVQIGLPNMQMPAVTCPIAREKQLGGGAIADEKTDQSAFLGIPDGTTDAKSARGNQGLAHPFFELLVWFRYEYIYLAK